MPKRKNILKEMFDVRPTRPDGSLDFKKIRKARRTVVISRSDSTQKNTADFIKISDVKRGIAIRDHVCPPRKKRLPVLRDEIEKESDVRRANVIQLGRITSNDFFSISKIPDPPRILKDEEAETFPEIPKEEIEKASEEVLHFFENRQKKENFRKEKKKRSYLHKNLNSFSALLFPSAVGRHIRGQHVFAFASLLIIFSLILPLTSYFEKIFFAKNRILESGNQAFGQFAEAKENMTSGQFDKAAVNFEESSKILSDAKKSISSLGGNYSDILRFIPGISKLASANYLIAAGENLALAGKNISDSAQTLGALENPLENDDSSGPALTDIFTSLRDGIQKTSQELDKAEENISKINIDDLPEEIKPQFLELKEKLPVINSSMKSFLDYSQIFLDILGYNGQRKFLFLFQNNQEIRATGGFIGSYGILDIRNGRIKKMFVDDIYNPDGQLQARVIPPEPIQKMSAVWTMHDANWFPDFPTSAEKVSWFYEKTGGPTVDGVIATTPSLIQDLLEITGPIEMPEYEMTVDSANFIEKTQEEVELNHDKETNQPKKFIADLTPLILDKVFNTKNLPQIVKVLTALNKALREKQLLLYSKNFNIEKLISDEGWSGEILNAKKDYLSVINTNIGGYKTDGIIDETIEHASEIAPDGSIIDTVTITRKHNGGDEKYDWWNKVNGDWLRVYIPEGSQLLEAEGQTREFVSPPLDYSSLNFKKDPQVQANEDSAQIDDESGTKIYTENHKTVFANWVYVSPGESVVLKYKYRLPFKLSFDSLHHPADSFSTFYQKQSGSRGSKLISIIKLPDNMKVLWHWPDEAGKDSNVLKMETNLNTDKFVGLAVEK